MRILGIQPVDMPTPAVSVCPSAMAFRRKGRNVKKQEEKRYYIYLKAARQWVEVPEEFYRDHTRYYDAFRKRQQYHGWCVCPKDKFWLCDGDCCVCEFRRAGDTISLDCATMADNGFVFTPLDALEDPSPSIESIICDKVVLEKLLARLEELMPEAIEIGQLRQAGLSDAAIAETIGIKRTTFLSRLKKVRKQLAVEFPDIFTY